MADLKADDTGNAIVPVLACVLNQLCIRNDRLPMSQRGVSKFHALRPPAISIKRLPVSAWPSTPRARGECFVLALVYIDRIIQSNPTVRGQLPQHPPSADHHRSCWQPSSSTTSTSTTPTTPRWGACPARRSTALEVEFLFLCNFALFVNTETYSPVLHRAVQPRRQRRQRVQLQPGPARAAARHTRLPVALLPAAAARRPRVVPHTQRRGRPQARGGRRGHDWGEGSGSSRPQSGTAAALRSSRPSCARPPPSAERGGRVAARALSV